MPYRVEIKPKAEKALGKMPKPDRVHIIRALEELEPDPRPKDAVKMVGSDSTYRVRVGDYRIVYEIVDRILFVYVVRIAHRKDVYRGF
jgi:mRNA interferase RelE/StbE